MRKTNNIFLILAGTLEKLRQQTPWHNNLAESDGIVYEIYTSKPLFRLPTN